MEVMTRKLSTIMNMQDGDGHDDDDDEGDGDDSDYDVHDCGDDADDDGDCVYGFLHSFIAKWRFTGGLS